MLDVITDWAKNIVLAVILISILEMLLPNNKTKKYIKMVLGIYLLFNIISPIINNRQTFSLSNFDINNYTSNIETQTNSETVNQESMDERIQEIYLEELEKDITTKLENKGYKIINCSVKGKFSSNEESKISEILLEVEKKENTENIKRSENEISSSENSEKQNKNENGEEKNDGETLETVMIEEIQKIKKVEIGEPKDDNQATEEKNNLNNTEIQEIKRFLIEEYGVNEKCLKIN